jgi:uncharacterized protein YcsI (UPF0317 family)
MDMDSKEKSLGLVLPDKFVFASFKTGNKQVSGNSITNLYTSFVMDNIDCHLSFEKLLTDANIIIDNDCTIPDWDFSNLAKDTLIDFLS